MKKWRLEFRPDEEMLTYKLEAETLMDAAWDAAFRWTITEGHPCPLNFWEMHYECEADGFGDPHYLSESEAVCLRRRIEEELWGSAGTLELHPNKPAD